MIYSLSPFSKEVSYNIFFIVINTWINLRYKLFQFALCRKVVVCSCEAELHEHIDRDQLSEELGGTVPYCHQEWLDQRVVSGHINAANNACAKYKVANMQ